MYRSMLMLRFVFLSSTWLCLPGLVTLPHPRLEGEEALPSCCQTFA